MSLSKTHSFLHLGIQASVNYCQIIIYVVVGTWRQRTGLSASFTISKLKFSDKNQPKMELEKFDKYRVVFFTGPAQKVLSVEDCKIPNRKRESEANFFGAGPAKKHPVELASSSIYYIIAILHIRPLKISSDRICTHILYILYDIYIIDGVGLVQPKRNAALLSYHQAISDHISSIITLQKYREEQYTWMELRIITPITS